EMSPTAAAIAAQLGAAGIDVAAAALHIDAREARWLVRLPGGRLAWFPTSDEGEARLRRERRVLRLLAERCAFQVPRILFESPEGWDVRVAVPAMRSPGRSTPVSGTP